MYCPVERGKKKKNNSKVCFHGYAKEVNIYENWKERKKKKKTPLKSSQNNLATEFDLYPE